MSIMFGICWSYSVSILFCIITWNWIEEDRASVAVGSRSRIPGALRASSSARHPYTGKTAIPQGWASFPGTQDLL